MVYCRLPRALCGSCCSISCRCAVPGSSNVAKRYFLEKQQHRETFGNIMFWKLFDTYMAKPMGLESNGRCICANKSGHGRSTYGRSSINESSSRGYEMRRSVSSSFTTAKDDVVRAGMSMALFESSSFGFVHSIIPAWAAFDFIFRKWPGRATAFPRVKSVDVRRLLKNPVCNPPSLLLNNFWMGSGISTIHVSEVHIDFAGRSILMASIRRKFPLWKSIRDHTSINTDVVWNKRSVRLSSLGWLPSFLLDLCSFIGSWRRMVVDILPF